jgi:hypothetical protein
MVIDMPGLTDRFIENWPADTTISRPPRPGDRSRYWPRADIARRGDVTLLPKDVLRNLDCAIPVRARLKRDRKSLSYSASRNMREDILLTLMDDRVCEDPLLSRRVQQIVGVIGGNGSGLMT